VPSNTTPRPILGVLLGGLAAGILDIVYAFVLAGLRGSTSLRVLQSVASGLLGAEAFKGGVATGALGLALHLAITLAAATVYFSVAKRSPLIQRHYLLFGTLFGVVVYLAMNFVVLPLSAVPFKISYTTLTVLQGFVSHAVLVGLPIAWCVRRFGFVQQDVPVRL
jgi:hypothetical protein